MGKMNPRKFNIEEYDYYVKEFVRKSEELGKPITHSNLREEPFCLPDARWYVKHCPDNSVTRWSEFVDWCGFIAKGKTPSKEKVVNLIYKLQEELGKPLMYDDFRGNGCYHVPIEIIREYWGTINKMKEELGLEINQESMIDKQLTKESFDNMIDDIYQFVSGEGRNFITTREIDAHAEWSNADTLRRMAKKYYQSNLQDLLIRKGVSLGRQGCGINFDFDDGEHITSQFEYMFSKYLKDYGLKYNVDYFRDVKYSTFIPECNNNMNCDYVIHIDGKTIYIEIAGIIEAYKEWFFNDRPITNRKSRERYRLKLLEKQKMLRDNNLIYFILFPCDLTHDNFKSILTDGSISLRKKIESFMKNNIDWVKIRDNGELKYSSDVKWGRNVINYEEAV